MTEGPILPDIDDTARPIYLDDRAELFCVVDLEDYDFALQWRWKAVKSKGRKLKWYAFRTTRCTGGRHVAIWLHKQICLRAHGLPPSVDHIITDHQDGQSLNNRRLNLAWATRSQNRRNIGGVASQQLRLAVMTQDSTRVLTSRVRGGAEGATFLPAK